jgi:hypothetical protein
MPFYGVEAFVFIIFCFATADKKKPVLGGAPAFSKEKMKKRKMKKEEKRYFVSLTVLRV